MLVFDLDTLDVHPPEYANDMPLQAGRWIQVGALPTLSPVVAESPGAIGLVRCGCEMARSG